MDKVIAVIMLDKDYRQQGQLQTYPRPSINTVNQMITSPAEADKIGAATLQEVEEIMNIAFPAGTQSPVATADTATTVTAQSVPPTVTPDTTVATAANCLHRRKQPRPASPSFMMNAIRSTT